MVHEFNQEVERRIQCADMPAEWKRMDVEKRQGKKRMNKQQEEDFRIGYRPSSPDIMLNQEEESGPSSKFQKTAQNISQFSQQTELVSNDKMELILQRLGQLEQENTLLRNKLEKNKDRFGDKGGNDFTPAESQQSSITSKWLNITKSSKS